MAKGSEMVKFEVAAYPALVPEERERVMSIIMENTDGAGIKPSDLDRIKMPSGGALYFNVKTKENPDGEPMKELKGIIIHRKMTRAYYEHSFEEGGGNDAPDCYSDDVLVGIGVGNPGGECANCPFSQFEGENPPKCAEKHLLMMVMEGDVLPRVVTIPPSGLKPLKNYLNGLSAAMVGRSSVITKIGLEKATGGSSGKIEFAKPTFAVAAHLPQEAVLKVAEYAREMGGLTKKVKAD